MRPAAAPDPGTPIHPGCALVNGSGEPGLVRIGDPIAALTHEEWLVSHHDARHDPPVRRALAAVQRLLTAPGR